MRSISAKYAGEQWVVIRGDWNHGKTSIAGGRSVGITKSAARSVLVAIAMVATPNNLRNDRLFICSIDSYINVRLVCAIMNRRGPGQPKGAPGIHLGAP